MKRFNRLGAAALLAIVPVACQEGSPTDVPVPQAILTQNGAVPTPEEVDLCKVGPAGTYNFSVSINPGPGLDGDATDGSVDLDAGACERIAFAGGAPDVVTVTENVPAGMQVDSIVVEQLAGGVVTRTVHTGTNTASGVMSGSGQEGAVLTFFNSVVPPPPGGQGCTPGYWKQSHHFDSWVGYAPGDDFDTTFGVNAFNPNLTLAAAAGVGGGGVRALARHAVAALLNAANPNVSYLYTEAQVIAMVQAALAGGDIEGTKNLFEAQNEEGCPLN